MILTSHDLFVESDEVFLQKNPMLREIWKQHKTLNSGGGG